MDLFTEHYRVIEVESQRLLLKGVRTGETLTIINADPETPLTEEDYPIGELISLTDESSQVN